MERINTLEDIARGLAALEVADPRLCPVIAGAGAIPLRRQPAGFASLTEIIVAQQVSKAAAETIFARLKGLVDPLTPEAMHAASDETLRAAGLSRPKQKTLRAIAAACLAGELDLDGLCALPAGDAIAAMIPVHGVGVWTAEIYLLFCAGHGDIFPARDLALQAAVADALRLESRPDEKTLIRIAESWSPWRGVAARLFWAHYAAMKGRDGVIGG